MSCKHPPEVVSSLLDGRLSPKEAETASAHLEACSECNSEYRSARNLRHALRSLDESPMPITLVTKLRVLASHERQRRLRHLNLAAAMRHHLDRLQLVFDNMMKPMALPFAGGLVSALLLFGTIVPSLAFSYKYPFDVPIMLYTDPDGKVVDWMQDDKHYYDNSLDVPRLEPVNSVVSGDSTAVEVTIDPEGRISDYAVVRGELTKAAESLILFSRFTPATLFGQPTWGKKLVVYRRPPARS